MPATRRNVILLVPTILLSLSPFYALRSRHAGVDRHIKQNAAGGAPKSGQAMIPMPLVAALFVSNGEFTSTLGVVNAAGISTYADVILRAPDGTQIAQQ